MFIIACYFNLSTRKGIKISTNIFKCLPNLYNFSKITGTGYLIEPNPKICHQTSEPLKNIKKSANSLIALHRYYIFLYSPHIHP